MNELKKSVITTPLGEMIALATEDNLVLLEFTDNENTEKDITQVEEVYGAGIEGENLPIKQIRVELEDYFKHQEIMQAILFYLQYLAIKYM